MSKALAKKILSRVSRFRIENRFAELTVGAGSEVHFWRIGGHRRGKLHVGAGSRVEAKLVIEREGAEIAIGDRSFVGMGHLSCARQIQIGDDVMIAWNTVIFDHASHSIEFSKRSRDVERWLVGQKDWSVVDMAPVRVCNKSWIGYGSVLLPGVQIGEGSIVGAGSVVTKDVPDWTIVAGNPARVIREIAEHER